MVGIEFGKTKDQVGRRCRERVLGKATEIRVISGMNLKPNTIETHRNL